MGGKSGLARAWPTGRSVRPLLSDSSMTRRFLAVLAFAVPAVAGCHRAGEVAGPTDDATLAVLGSGTITCGAVAISRDLAVTANHCVPEAVVHYLLSPED